MQQGSGIHYGKLSGRLKGIFFQDKMRERISCLLVHNLKCLQQRELRVARAKSSHSPLGLPHRWQGCHLLPPSVCSEEETPRLKPGTLARDASTLSSGWVYCTTRLALPARYFERDISWYLSDTMWTISLKEFHFSLDHNTFTALTFLYKADFSVITMTFFKSTIWKSITCSLCFVNKYL